ncbi:MAG: hypothetical protein Hals2KO_08910 [Halioglobus sp.]
MPSTAVIRTFIREITTRERSPRCTEPDLVMDDPEKVAAYIKAGLEHGVMAPVYLYHCAQICEVIRPGDHVIDLGCGPATQLAMVARLNPDTRFTGVDLSDDMLNQARQHCADMGLENVDFVQQDVSDLAHFATDSVDAVMSTVALHHLPDLSTLDATFAEVARVLRPGGGLYLLDFGHLKSEKSIEAFAYQYADRQSELFTLDYLYSLRAAFSRNEFAQLTQRHLQGRARLYSTFGMPFMMAVKSPARGGEPDARVLQELAHIKEALPAHHQTDLADLTTFFRLGGLRASLL